MAEQIRQTEEVSRGPGEQKTTRTVTNANDEAAPPVEKTNQGTAQRLVWFVTGVILTLLAFRFILSLLGANRSNGFADFIYGVSYPFVAPFFGLFNYKVQDGVARFEIETLVAIFFYVVVAAGLVQLIKIMRKEA